MATIYSLYVNNKHGTLIYQKDFTQRVQLSANDKIILASTFHGISGIAAQLTPPQTLPKTPLDFLKPRGISIIEAPQFKLHCFETITGLKFLAVASPGLSAQICENHLKKTYELFTDYVLKNPFHDIDMPIRCVVFDREIRKLFAEYITLNQTAATE